MGTKPGLSTLREENRLKVFENKVLIRIFGPQREEEGENNIKRIFKICIFHLILAGRLHQGAQDGQSMLHASGRLQNYSRKI
jgi:hypothetical protein